MKLIYEENIENSDFLELVLSEYEIDKLNSTGVVEEFPGGLQGKRDLNIFIRKEENAISKRRKSENARRVLRER